MWVTFLLLPYTSKRTEAGPVKPKHPGLKGAMSSIRSAGAKKVGGLGLLNRLQGDAHKVRVGASEEWSKLAVARDAILLTYTSSQRTLSLTAHYCAQGKKRPAGGFPRSATVRLSPYMPLKDEKPSDLPARTDMDGLPVYDYQPSRFCNFSGDNRMVVLLFWDLLCFGGIGSLYVLSLKYLSENADHLSAANPFEFSCEAYGEGCSRNASSDASGAWEIGRAHV